MICPKCEEDINLSTHMKEWDDNYGEDAGTPVMINIFCEHCDENVFMIFIEEVGGHCEIESSVGTVRVPELVKTKNE